MVKPATARRRNKIQQQQAAQAAQAAQASQQKEDEASGLHDEADVMSFRSAATHRFLLNQELIENITEKWVHTDSIIRPKPFASVHTTKDNISDIKDELYFGNLSLMQQKLAKLEKEVEELNNSPNVNEELKVIKSLNKSIDALSSTFSEQTPVNYPQVEKEYKELTTKSVNKKKYVIRSLPALKTDKSEAPVGYWEELARARDATKAASMIQAVPQVPPINNNADLVMADSYNIPTTTNVPDQLNYVPNGFSNDDMNMIDDVGFGLHSTLDDQDFLSQIDHSME